jgi:hypothetical protein
MGITMITQSSTNVNQLFDSDRVTERLLARLHKGGKKYFIQTIDAGKRRSEWHDVCSSPFVVPQNLRTKHNVYFGVNPTTVAVTEIDRQKYTNLMARTKPHQPMPRSTLKLLAFAQRNKPC